MSSNYLNERLLEPNHKTDLLGLASVWRQCTINLVLEGMAGFAHSPSLLNKVRGSFGRVLVERGSQFVRDRKPCQWNPVCGAEVFFARKPIVKIGPYSSEITKPYILRVSSDQKNLVISLGMFGVAGEWRREVEACLIEALQSRVRWKNLAKDVTETVPDFVRVLSSVNTSIDSLEISSPPLETRISFLTPVDAERGVFIEQPYLIFERLMRRIYMMARWHFLELDQSWEEMSKMWRGCEYCFEASTMSKFVIGGHKFSNRITSGHALKISGNLDKLWPLLVFGQATNVGRGANVGLGHFCIS